MGGYRTKFGEPVMRVLMQYPTQAQQTQALEVLIETALARKGVEETAELAAKTCRGMHPDKPGRGVVCDKCFNAVATHGGRREAPAPEGVESVPRLDQKDEEFVKGLLG